jgi:hypothetical protein
VFRRDASSCGGRNSPDSTPAYPWTLASAGPADGPRGRYGVQGSNRRFSTSPMQTGTHASVGVIGGEPNVEITDRQAAGASVEPALVRQPNDMESRCGRTEAGNEGHRPLRMMRTLSSNELIER